MFFVILVYYRYSDIKKAPFDIWSVWSWIDWNYWATFKVSSRVSYIFYILNL